MSTEVVEVATADVEGTVGDLLEEAAASRYESTLAWSCAAYLDGEPRDDSLLPLLYLAELAGSATGRETHLYESAATQEE